MKSRTNTLHRLATMIAAVPAAVESVDDLSKIDGVESIGEGDSARLMIPVESLYSEHEPSGRLVLTADASEFSAEVDGQDTKFRFAAEDVAGLKATVDKLKTGAGRLRAYEKLGTTEEIDAALRIATELEKLEGGTVDEKAKALAQAKIDRVIAEGEGKRAPLVKLVNRLLRDAAIEDAMTEAGVHDDHRDAVRAMLDPQVILDLEDIDVEKIDDVRPFVKGDDGKPRMSDKPESTDDMTVSELVESMRSSYEGYFTGDNAGGGGSQENETDESGAKGGGDTPDYAKMTTEEKREYAKEHGSGALGDLAAEATRAEIAASREKAAQANESVRQGTRKIV